MRLEIRLSEWAPRLGTRNIGTAIRARIERAWNDASVVTLNFDGVESVSASFADEVLGILVQQKGLDAVKAKVPVINVNTKIRPIIQGAILRRAMLGGQ